MTLLPVIVDDSHWNNEPLPTFEQDSVAGVIHKATQGLTYVDPNYVQRTQSAKAGGLLCGAFHFGTGDDGIAQADHFLNVVKPDSKTLVALDLEANPDGSSMLLPQAEVFTLRIKEKLGRLPVLYTGAWYTKEIMPTDYAGILTQCDLWIASYELEPILPVQWKTYRLWQYTDGVDGDVPKHLPGISANLDLDRFYGTLGDLQAWWGS